MNGVEIIYTVISSAYATGEFKTPVAMEMLLIAMEMLENNNF